MGSPPAIGPKGVGFGWQPKAGTLTFRSSDAEASSRDVECRLSEEKGAVAGLRG